jgi:uncharacterized protein (TIGR02145 family)
MNNLCKASGIFLIIILIFSCEKKQPQPVPPVISTMAISMISASTALSGGVITDEGGTTIISRGICWNTTVDPTIENSKTTESGNTLFFTNVLTQLLPSTLYYVRAYATNSAGTGYGKSMAFTTLGSIPSVTQVDVNQLINTATLTVSVYPNYLPTTVIIEWGTTIKYENTTTPMQIPVTGNTSVNVSVDLSDLTPGTTYHVRIKATNELGTKTGNDVIFTTYVVSDIDSNFYHAVTIGTQTWMSENLKTTKYNNGDIIGTTSSPRSSIAAESNPKYQWAYDGIETNVAIYGRLYTWYAVTDDRNVCPTGWHVPTDDEWTILTTYLGGENVAGGKLKETGTVHWFSTDAETTNETGFTALPGGCRISNDSAFYGIWFDGYWWSSTSLVTGSVISSWDRDIANGSMKIQRAGWPKMSGLSVRCVKD